MNFKPGELIRLIYGGESTRSGNSDERLQRWADAFDDWLDERYTRFSPNVGPDSHRAWEEFLAFTRKAPWEVQVVEVEAYIKMLEGKGLSTGTIHKRLTGLKKFYEFCREKAPVLYAHGTGSNPVAQVKRPKVKLYEKANYLSLEEERAFLEVIKNDPSVIGKRDYALFLLLLRTGCRAGEARNLRWGGVGVGAGGVGSKGAGEPPLWKSRDRLHKCEVNSGGEGDEVRRVALPEEVWEAILGYLRASGRLDL